MEEYRFSGSESSVRKCVQKLRGQVSEAFIPLESDAGKMGQVDWGTAVAQIAGVERTIHLFVLRLRHSGVAFVQAYFHETMECFLDGHEKGSVEKGVGFVRRNALVPFPRSGAFPS